MKKETVIAVILGVSFGVVVAFFMIFKTKNQESQKVKPITTAVHISPTVVVKNVGVQPLEITQPESGIITATNSVTISGKAVKGSLMVIQSPIKTSTFTNDKETFSVAFPLAFGENVILISSYPKDAQGAPQEKELKIYYLDEQ